MSSLRFASRSVKRRVSTDATADLRLIGTECLRQGVESMDAETVSQEIEELAGLARPELIDVLAKAAEDDDVGRKRQVTSRVFSGTAASKSPIAPTLP